jgi:type II secretory pathway pseudopilin PulG
MKPMHRDEGGFSLVEVLLGAVLVGIVATLGVTMLSSVQRSTDVTRAEIDGVEEARLALNRMSREIRQAREIVRVINPDGAAYDPNALTAIVFKADFDDDGCIDGADPAPGDTGGCNADDVSDPELLSYCHQPATSSSSEPQLFVIRGALAAGATACTGGEPILAEDVAHFKIEYRSNVYRYDLSPADGVTTWTELDAAPAPTGNGNGVLDVELAGITTTTLSLELQNPGLELRTQVALRNRT